MEKRPYKTDGERDQIISEQGDNITIVRHINVDGSKELHIFEGAPRLSISERIAAIEARLDALELPSL